MTQEPLWHVIGQSVRGASHVRADLPNQDAIIWRHLSREGPPLVLVVSDGHGSAKSFRSDRGSKFAVTAAADLMQELLSGVSDPLNLSAVKRVAEQRLPKELVRRWQMAVDADLGEDPFSEEELAKLAQQRGESNRRKVIKTPRLAYGATVLGVLVARDFFLFLQLGDGDILWVADDGTVTRPFSRDARLIANETTSLCMSDAWREVRLRFQANYGDLPALIMASTDGYANSFVNDDAFRKVGSDILAIMREDGVGLVGESLPEWLSEASAAGSGDDISLGILYRADALRPKSGLVSIPDAVSVPLDPGAAPLSGAADVVPAEPDSGPADKVGGTSRDRPVVSERRSLGESGRRRVAEDQEMRSRFVARIKHDGPSEPSKHAALADAVGEGKDAPDDTATDSASAEAASADSALLS